MSLDCTNKSALHSVDNNASTTDAIHQRNSLELLTAFDNNVTASQWVYRQLLKAMSEPATILPLSQSSAIVSAAVKTEPTVETVKKVPRLYADDWQHEQLYSTTWSVAQSLLDSDCRIVTSTTLSQKSILQSIRFYTDAKVAQTAQQAQFAFINLDEWTDNNLYSTGSLIAPHESCTLVIQVPDISNEPHILSSGLLLPDLLLTGPGIKTQKSLSIAGLTPLHIEFLIENNHLYPCGIDIIFCSPTHVAALPRSTVIDSPSHSPSHSPSITSEVA
jgi:phosphonate C-P lyase system protein PhnH